MSFNYFVSIVDVMTELGDQEVLEKLEQAILLSQNRLQLLAEDNEFLAKMKLAFGATVNPSALHSAWTEGDFSSLPTIKVRYQSELNGAIGAYSTSRRTIYLASEYLQQESSIEAVATLFLEEYGHHVDILLNGSNDSAGDEGHIFATLGMGEDLSPEELANLRTEDDQGEITIDGEVIAVEMATFTGDEQDNINDISESNNTFSIEANGNIINYSDRSDKPYANQDFSDDLTFDNDTAILGGNTWKALGLDYKISPDTILTFEFKSNQIGEIQGLGFEDDLELSQDKIFNLYGSQNTWGIRDFTYTNINDWQTFEINLGSFITGYINYLILTNDDDANANANSQFRNLVLSENPASNTFTINVNGTGISKSLERYGDASVLNGISRPQDTDDAIVTYANNGNEVKLENNAWKAWELGDYNVTEDTVLRFQFRSQDIGELLGIGLDNNDNLFDNPHTLFQLYGSDTYEALEQDFNNYQEIDGWKNYEISLGQYFTGNYDRLVLFSDNDANNNLGGSAEFRNIILEEINPTSEELTITIKENSETNALETYGDASVLNGNSLPQDRPEAVVTYLDNGNEVKLENNAWKAWTPFEVGSYTITSDTVLTFDYMSTEEGEIQGIGFDNNDNFFDNTEYLFQLFGTQVFGDVVQDFNTYNLGDGWKSYSLNVGEYFTGTFDRIFFANDNDTPENLGSNSSFRNLILFDAVTPPINNSPSANNDDYSTDEETVINDDFLINDEDLDNDSLTITQINGSIFTEGNPITLSSGALLTINNDDTFSYDPNGQFDGLLTGQTATDSFTYTITDGTDSDTATVNLTINGVSSPPFSYGENEEELLLSTFDNDGFEEGWTLDSGMAIANGELILADGQWRGAHYDLAPFNYLDLDEVSFSLYWSARGDRTETEKAKFFVEANFIPDSEGENELKMSVRPSQTGINPNSEYHHLYVDPGFMEEHKKDAFLQVPQGQFIAPNTYEKFRLQVEKTGEDLVEVSPFYWDETASVWKPFEDFLDISIPPQFLAPNGDLTPPVQTNPMKLSIIGDLGQDFFDSISLRFRLPGYSAIDAFAIAVQGQDIITNGTASDTGVLVFGETPLANSANFLF